tara:strand:- start:50 stop:229 length:180 start_codon:yes stop_codon:yes gene_type:complete
MSPEIIDTLQTTAVGITGSAVAGLGILPDAVSILVGLITIVYLVLKIKVELATINKKKG